MKAKPNTYYYYIKDSYWYGVIYNKTETTFDAKLTEISKELYDFILELSETPHDCIKYVYIALGQK